MKVVIIAPGLLPVPAIRGGAVEQLIDTYIDENKHDKESDELVVFSVSNEIEKTKIWEEDNVQYIQIPYYKKSKFLEGKYGGKVYAHIQYNQYLKVIKNYLEKNEYDCIVIENRPQFVKEINKVSKAPIYLHLHNEEFSNNYKRYKDVPEKVDTIIVVSDYIKNRIHEKYKCNNVKVLHNGIKINRFKKESNDLLRKEKRRQYSISEDSFVILFTGRFTKEKGVLELVKAFSKLNYKSNLELVVIGSGWFGENNTSPYIEEVKREAKKCENRIIFTGYLDNQQVAEVESVVDLAVIPSLWNDPLPLVVIEAMASEIPVITTKSGGIPEMCDDTCGVLLKRDNEIVDNIALEIASFEENKDKRIKYGKKARDKAINEFTTKHYYDQFKAILENKI